MAKYLVIVESPAKVKPLRNFLGVTMMYRHQTDMCVTSRRVSLVLM